MEEVKGSDSCQGEGVLCLDSKVEIHDNYRMSLSGIQFFIIFHKNPQDTTDRHNLFENKTSKNVYVYINII